MEIIVLYVIFAAIVGVIAGSWGRSGFIWFLLSIVISPLLGIIILIIVGKARDRGMDRISPSTHVICPDCAEHIRKEARVCKHCGCRLAPVTD